VMERGELPHDVDHMRTIEFRRALGQCAGAEFNDDSFITVFHNLSSKEKVLIKYHQN